MDAVNSSRWTDSFISTTLGIVSQREWAGILNTNPYYRFAQRSVTASATGLVAYTALNSGTGDTAQTVRKILAVTDGNQIVYQWREFRDIPLATVSSTATAVTSDHYCYDAGTSFQVVPVEAAALVVSVNHTPPRVDSLSADSVTIDFPDGSEVILWLEAAAMLLSKGAAENDAAQTMRAMADQERQNLYAQIARRTTKPFSLGFSDAAASWAG